MEKGAFLKDQKKAGIVLSYLNMGTRMAVNFLYIPVIIKYISKEQYGLYEMMWALVNFLTLIDFGFYNTITRFFSSALASENNERIKETVKNSYSVYTVIVCSTIAIGALLCCGAIIFYRHILSESDLQIMRSSMPLMVLLIGLTSAGNLFTALITAYEKFIFLKTSSIVHLLLQPSVVVFVFHFSAGIPQLISTEIACLILLISIYVFYCHRYLGITERPSFSFTQLSGKMFKFSFFIFLNMLADRIMWSSGQTILGIISGKLSVTYYSLSFSFSYAFIALNYVTAGTFYPAFAAAAEKGGLESVRALFWKTGRLQFRLTLLFACGFILLGREFIQIWLGPGFEQCYLLSGIILTGLLPDFCIINGLPAVQALNRHSKRSAITLTTAFCALILEIILSRYFNEYGCAAAAGICLFLGNGIATMIYYSKIGLGIKKLFAGFARPLTAAVPAFITTYAAIQIIPDISGFKGFIFHLLMLMSIYAAFTLLIGLNKEEKQQFLRISGINLFYNKHS
ncbi:MAG: hypothetical protein J6Z08_05590 [Elusimicrobiales bacterium]|nr:hypothetical protein [Elusimicrobiales bacterium]